MTIELERTEADYEARLVARVATWEASHVEEAAEMRLVAQRRLGMHEPPPRDGLRWLVLEQAFREDVRKLKGWPTKDAWMRGER